MVEATISSSPGLKIHPHKPEQVMEVPVGLSTHNYIQQLVGQDCVVLNQGHSSHVMGMMVDSPLLSALDVFRIQVPGDLPQPSKSIRHVVVDSNIIGTDSFFGDSKGRFSLVGVMLAEYNTLLNLEEPHRTSDRVKRLDSPHLDGNARKQALLNFFKKCVQHGYYDYFARFYPGVLSILESA